MLPDSIANGDFILFDAMGAYTVSSRSHLQRLLSGQLGSHRPDALRLR